MGSREETRHERRGIPQAPPQPPLVVRLLAGAHLCALALESKKLETTVFIRLNAVLEKTPHLRANILINAALE